MHKAKSIYFLFTKKKKKTTWPNAGGGPKQVPYLDIPIHFWKWKFRFANFNRGKIWTKNALLFLENEVYIYLKNGNAICEIKLGYRCPKSLSLLYVKNSRFFLSSFLEKDEYPRHTPVPGCEVSPSLGKLFQFISIM